MTDYQKTRQDLGYLLYSNTDRWFVQQVIVRP